MIAPDPSPTITETPARGMNSRIAWTVFRETKSFYGVAHDRLSRVVGDSVTAVRATVSTSFVPGEADRQIGVWCVRRKRFRHDATATGTARAIDNRIGPESLRTAPVTAAL